MAPAVLKVISGISETSKVYRLPISMPITFEEFLEKIASTPFFHRGALIEYRDIDGKWTVLDSETFEHFIMMNLDRPVFAVAIDRNNAGSFCSIGRNVEDWELARYLKGEDFNTTNLDWVSRLQRFRIASPEERQIMREEFGTTYPYFFSGLNRIQRFKNATPTEREMIREQFLLSNLEKSGGHDRFTFSGEFAATYPNAFNRFDYLNRFRSIRNASPEDWQIMREEVSLYPNRVDRLNRIRCYRNATPEERQIMKEEFLLNNQGMFDRLNRFSRYRNDENLYLNNVTTLFDRINRAQNYRSATPEERQLIKEELRLDGLERYQ